MANRWSRMYNFANGALADAEQVDAELDQILAALNLLDQGSFTAPFLLQQKSGLKATGTATALAPGKNSQDWVFQGSGWDGAAAQARELTWRLVVTDANTYRLALLGNTLAELLAIDQAGLLTLKQSGPQLLLKPSITPPADTKLLAVEQADGTPLFSVDIEGDVFLDVLGAWKLPYLDAGKKLAALALGTDGQVLRATGPATAPAFENDKAALGFVIDGGNAVIATGVQGDLEVPFACEIESVTLLADRAGSIVIDIWRSSFANAPPTAADSITGTASPTLSAAQKSQDTALTGWTKDLAEGDILRFNVDSADTVQRVAIMLKVRKT